MIAKLITYKRKDEAKENYAHLGGKSPLVGYTQELIEELKKGIDDASVHTRHPLPKTCSKI